jgi:hypothetical protein
MTNIIIYFFNAITQLTFNIESADIDYKNEICYLPTHSYNFDSKNTQLYKIILDYKNPYIPKRIKNDICK